MDSVMRASVLHQHVKSLPVADIVNDCADRKNAQLTHRIYSDAKDNFEQAVIQLACAFARHRAAGTAGMTPPTITVDDVDLALREHENIVVPRGFIAFGSRGGGGVAGTTDGRRRRRSGPPSTPSAGVSEEANGPPSGNSSTTATTTTPAKKSRPRKPRPTKKALTTPLQPVSLLSTATAFIVAPSTLDNGAPAARAAVGAVAAEIGLASLPASGMIV